MDPGHSGYAGQPPEQKLLVVGHVRYHNLDQIVGALSGDDATLQHLWVTLNLALKRLKSLRCVSIHGDANMGGEGQPQLLLFQQRHPAFDNALRL